jgi:hypothetical protein
MAHRVLLRRPTKFYLQSAGPMTPSKKFTGGNRCQRLARVSIWAGSATSKHCWST